MMNIFILGGSTLYIETVLKKVFDPDSKDPGALEITGNLGTVMKESIQLAYTYSKSFLTQYEPENEFLQKAQLHLHVPEVSLHIHLWGARWPSGRVIDYGARGREFAVLCP